jgi:hypothetical protein
VNSLRNKWENGRKDEPNIVLCGNCTGHHNMERKIQRHVIG